MNNTALSSNCCVILAAGAGKRMHSPLSKVLCQVACKPMISWITDTVKASDIGSICVVVSSDDVAGAVPGCEIRYQTERLGTGHAVMCASDYLEKGFENVLVLCGDAPFMSADTILSALKFHTENNNDLTVISAVLDDPARYGRIIRGKDNDLQAITEAADCTEEQLAIREINSGAFWFRVPALCDALKRIRNDNAQGEYYLTDTVQIIRSSGGKTGCFASPDPDIVLGANSPADLLRLNEIAIDKIIKNHLANGVHFLSTDGVVIGPDVTIQPGSRILPGTMLYGNTSIGASCEIGPNTILENVKVGNGCTVLSSVVRGSLIGDNVTVGPFAHIRQDTSLHDNINVGAFVETKNSDVGEGTSVAHLTYLGDADIGKYCNFGCGTVIANYDGTVKSRTVIGDYAFIGCNTNLIPPVTVGSYAYTAAGTTVTRDIPEGALAVGRVKETILPEWGKRKLKAYIEKKNKLKNK